VLFIQEKIDLFPKEKKEKERITGVIENAGIGGCDKEEVVCL
jgi:hypothetical protein